MEISVPQGTIRGIYLERDDVLAWPASMANLARVDLEAAATRYPRSCPKCGAPPCRCAVT
jgi:hypothetical protein